MPEIGSWNGHSFTVSPTLIRGFTGLTIKGSSETENKTSSSQNYVSRKNGNPSEINLTVELNALTGCDVKEEALKFVDEAHNGSKNYFYLGGKKLIPCQLMLTEASVSETSIAPNGTWVSCKVKLTMKQCAKYDGTGGGSGSNSGGGSSGGGKKTSSSSSKKTSTKTTSIVSKVTTAVKNVVNKVKTTVQNVASKVSSAVKKISTVVNNAKKASSTTKKSTTTIAKKVSTVQKKVKMLAK